MVISRRIHKGKMIRKGCQKFRNLANKEGKVGKKISNKGGLYKGKEKKELF